MKRDGNTLLKKAGGDADMLFPVTTRTEMDEALQKIPRHVMPHVDTLMSHCSTELQRFMLAALAAKAVDLETRPNASYTLYPHGLAPGATAAVNTNYALNPFIGPQDQGTALFVRGQRFYGILTGHADTINGWCITGGSLKVSFDAISGVLYDTSFSQWEADVVASRVTTGEYQGFEVVDQANFFCSAALRSLTAVPMIEGVTVSLYDFRCINAEMMRVHFGGNESFGELLRDLMDGAQAGWGPKRMYRRISDGR
jgi:hypothetical protein